MSGLHDPPAKRLCSEYGLVAYILVPSHGTSVRLSEKPLIEILGLFMDYFVILVIVLHVPSTLTQKTTHENPVAYILAPYSLTSRHLSSSV